MSEAQFIKVQGKYREWLTPIELPDESDYDYSLKVSINENKIRFREFFKTRKYAVNIFFNVMHETFLADYFARAYFEYLLQEFDNDGYFAIMWMADLPFSFERKTQNYLMAQAEWYDGAKYLLDFEIDFDDDISAKQKEYYDRMTRDSYFIFDF